MQRLVDNTKYAYSVLVGNINKFYKKLKKSNKYLTIDSTSKTETQSSPDFYGEYLSYFSKANVIDKQTYQPVFLRPPGLEIEKPKGQGKLFFF
jgi:hypothetical protein